MLSSGFYDTAKCTYSISGDRSLSNDISLSDSDEDVFVATYTCHYLISSLSLPNIIARLARISQEKEGVLVHIMPNINRQEMVHLPQDNLVRVRSHAPWQRAYKTKIKVQPLNSVRSCKLASGIIERFFRYQIIVKMIVVCVLIKNLRNVTFFFA